MTNLCASTWLKNSQTCELPEKVIQEYLSSMPCNIPIISETETCSAIYRNRHYATYTEEDAREKLYNGNVCDMLAAKIDEYRDFPCFGTRKVESIDIKEPWPSSSSASTLTIGDKEITTFFPTVVSTYGEMWEKVLNITRGFSKLGIKKGVRVGIYENTREEWTITCIALWCLGAELVTVYASLGYEALGYAIKESEMMYIISNGKLVPTILSLMSKVLGDAPLTHIIYTDDLSCVDEDAALPVTKKPIVCVRYNCVVREGAAMSKKEQQTGKKNERVKLNPSDIAVIMYTSGTTGDPKAVIITHGNFHACTLMLTKRIKHFLGPIKENVRYLAYLPLAHIFEFSVEIVMLMLGSYIGFGTAKTLLDSYTKPHGDFQEFKPHFFAGVPRIYDLIRKEVELTISPSKRALFDSIISYRLQCLDKGIETPYLNENIFAPIRAIFGGHLRTMITGGAPMSARTQEWFAACSGAYIVQGYGLTETCGLATTQLPGDMKRECLGMLQDGVEVKVRDVDQWTHNSVHDAYGEILFRGPIVNQRGYYKKPELTIQVFDEDGWFASGDIGSISKKDGTFRVTGRIKSIAKNVYGEYIALEALENIYVTNDLCVPNGVCVLVDPSKSYISAVILSTAEKAEHFARAQKIHWDGWPQILNNPDFHAHAARSLANTAAVCGKKRFEQVRYVQVVDDEWTVDNGVLTAAQKLKRRMIEVRYLHIIKELFKY